MFRSQEHQDIVCQKLQRSVPAVLSYGRKLSGHYFERHGINKLLSAKKPTGARSVYYKQETDEKGQHGKFKNTHMGFCEGSP